MDLTVSDNDPNIIWLAYNSPHGVLKGTYNPDSLKWAWLWDTVGLPLDFACKRIVYQKGSNDGLYLATNRGVYYKNASLSGWIPFQAGLPYIDISSLDINYCSSQIRAATLGRGVYTCPLYSDVNNTQARHITSSETWNYNRDVGATIIIDSGAALTIDNNAIINMANGADIIVAPGAKLVVDTATLTNLCDTNWDGIIVQGNKLKNQDLSGGWSAASWSLNQGFVFLNNTTIENAYEALRVWDYTQGWVNESNTSTQGGTGGIVVAENSTFLNNRRDAEFMWYRDYPDTVGVEIPNQSVFINCHFKTDSNYNQPSPFFAFTTMWGTYGISFQGCDFTVYNTGQYTQTQQLGYGLESIDASYTVSKHQPNQ